MLGTTPLIATRATAPTAASATASGTPALAGLFDTASQEAWSLAACLVGTGAAAGVVVEAFDRVAAQSRTERVPATPALLLAHVWQAAAVMTPAEAPSTLPGASAAAWLPVTQRCALALGDALGLGIDTVALVLELSPSDTADLIEHARRELRLVSSALTLWHGGAPLSATLAAWRNEHLEAMPAFSVELTTGIVGHAASCRFCHDLLTGAPDPVVQLHAIGAPAPPRAVLRHVREALQPLMADTPARPGAHSAPPGAADRLRAEVVTRWRRTTWPIRYGAIAVAFLALAALTIVLTRDDPANPVPGSVAADASDAPPPGVRPADADVAGTATPDVSGAAPAGSSGFTGSQPGAVPPPTDPAAASAVPPVEAGVPTTLPPETPSGTSKPILSEVTWSVQPGTPTDAGGLRFRITLLWGCSGGRSEVGVPGHPVQKLPVSSGPLVATFDAMPAGDHKVDVRCISDGGTSIRTQTVTVK